MQVVWAFTYQIILCSITLRLTPLQLMDAKTSGSALTLILPQKYLIGLIYRHPESNVCEFTAKFNECLQKVNGANIKCIVLGD